MFALAFLLLCSAAHADLYRWVDPESGSVKLSSAPPPWFDTGAGPQVERIPYVGREGRAAPANEARWRELLLAISTQPTRERLQALATLSAELDRADPGGAARRREEFEQTLRRTQR